MSDYEEEGNFEIIKLLISNWDFLNIKINMEYDLAKQSG